MSDSTSFLSTELTEMGLIAAADPRFAERLIEALQRLSAQQDNGANGSAGSDLDFAALQR